MRSRVTLAAVLAVLLAVVGCSGPVTDATAVARAVEATLTASVPTAIQPSPVSPTEAPTPTSRPTSSPVPSPTHTNAPTIKPPTPTPPEPTPVTGVVQTTALNVRDGPATSYPVTAKLRQGDTVFVLGRADDTSWYRIGLEGGGSGWVSADLVKLSIPREQLALADTPTPKPSPTATPTPDMSVVHATASAQARLTASAQASATITSYRRVPPKGQWCSLEGGIIVCVAGFKYFYATDYFTAGSGNKFVSFAIRVSNHTSESIHVNPLNVTLVDFNNRTYGHSSVGYSYFTTPLDAVDVQPGDNAAGGIMFAIKNDNGPAKIVYENFLGPTIVIDLRREPDQAQ